MWTSFIKKLVSLIVKILTGPPVSITSLFYEEYFIICSSGVRTVSEFWKFPNGSLKSKTPEANLLPFIKV